MSKGFKVALVISAIAFLLIGVYLYVLTPYTISDDSAGKYA